METNKPAKFWNILRVYFVKISVENVGYNYAVAYIEKRWVKMKFKIVVLYSSVCYFIIGVLQFNNEVF